MCVYVGGGGGRGREGWGGDGEERDWEGGGRREKEREREDDMQVVIYRATWPHSQLLLLYKKMEREISSCAR